MKALWLGQFKTYLRLRPRDAHKGDFGRVLVVGGDKGYAGAPRMAAEAALRVGAGLVVVATHPMHAAMLNMARPEIICHGVNTVAELNALLRASDVVVIGPGLGQSAWSKKMLNTVLKAALPMVVDADALNLLAKHPMKKTSWILTPHPAEAGRLLKMSTQRIQEAREKAVGLLQKKYGGIAVLKGAGTLVCGSDHSAFTICEAGNPGMATAGMGDVLSGVIGGLLAQAVPLLEAAQMGVLIHAMAGDLAAAEGGERGMLATDLMPYIRQLMNPE